MKKLFVTAMFGMVLANIPVWACTGNRKQEVQQTQADKDGYVQHIDALKIAYGGKLLGAGREKKTDEIDYGVGIFLNKKTGEPVKAGDTLCTIYSNDEAKTQSAVKYCKEGILLSDTKPVVHDLIYKIIK